MIRRILLGLVLLSTITCEASNGLALDVTRTGHCYGEADVASLLSMLQRIVFNDHSILKFEPINSNNRYKKAPFQSLYSQDTQRRHEDWEDVLFRVSQYKIHSNSLRNFTMIQSDLSPPAYNL